MRFGAGAEDPAEPGLTMKVATRLPMAVTQARMTNASKPHFILQIYFVNPAGALDGDAETSR